MRQAMRDLILRWRRLLTFAVLVAASVACGSRTGLPLATDETRGMTGSTPSGGAAGATAGTGTGAMPGVPIYVLDATHSLQRFDPPTATFTTIGPVDCHTSANLGPSAMAVDRAGVAYVVFDDFDPNRDVLAGPVYRVSTSTAECEPTGASIDPPEVVARSMAFVADPSARSETLYAFATSSSSQSLEFVSVDTRTLALNVIGEPMATAASLIFGGGRLVQVIGTGAGNLFAVHWNVGSRYEVARLDRTSGLGSAIGSFSVKSDFMPAAAVFWGGDFYVFGIDLPTRVGVDRPGGGTLVMRFRPEDGSFRQVAQWPGRIVLAAAPTSAPTQ
jgi:hypothetical protein